LQIPQQLDGSIKWGGCNGNQPCDEMKTMGFSAIFFVQKEREKEDDDCRQDNEQHGNGASILSLVCARVYG
jgi:hypothetical protein